jgi:hypothetical protein
MAQEAPEWLAGTWEYKPRFGEPSWFEFADNTWVYYRAGEKHSNGIFTISDSTVILRNPSGREMDEITITENSFEYWGSIFTKK